MWASSIATAQTLSLRECWSFWPCLVERSASGWQYTREKSPLVILSSDILLSRNDSVSSQSSSPSLKVIVFPDLHKKSIQHADIFLFASDNSWLFIMLFNGDSTIVILSDLLFLYCLETVIFGIWGSFHNQLAPMLSGHLLHKKPLEH